jgi:hypothetical protein
MVYGKHEDDFVMHFMQFMHATSLRGRFVRRPNGSFLDSALLAPLSCLLVIYEEIAAIA